MSLASRQAIPRAKRLRADILQVLDKSALDGRYAVVRNAARFPLRHGGLRNAEAVCDGADRPARAVERCPDVHDKTLGGLMSECKGKLSATPGGCGGTDSAVRRGTTMSKQRDLTQRELAVMDRIQSVMLGAGLNWSALAVSVAKTVSSGSQWSGRRSFPREQTLYLIAQRLGVEMGWLLTGDEPTEQRQAQTENEKSMLGVMREMSPAEQSALLAAARGIRGSLTKK
jgi:transcriptional regulator with XRE-family HTH domain